LSIELVGVKIPDVVVNNIFTQNPITSSVFGINMVGAWFDGPLSYLYQNKIPRVFSLNTRREGGFSRTIFEVT